MSRRRETEHVVLAMTGASGLPYALRLLECLIAANCRVSLIASKAAHAVAALELDDPFPARHDALATELGGRYGAAEGQVTGFARQDWTAPFASGSNPPDTMVVCPCTTGTLGAIANGLSDSLIERTADVCLKERRDLVIVPREAPLTAIALRQMTQLAELGAVILPPSPAFYHRPQTIQDLIDFTVARILDQIDVPHELHARWGERDGG
ncbi:flavin prenyltransferase UbiX [Guyparkeria sp. TX1]|uniref:flavin prenyltransferase UbiX n=1 Tax=Guyparkeria sp. TX1 TaxID=3115001 RepID=UPI0039779CA9